MLVCTDRAAADAAFAAKAPRPWREVVLEVYPEATVDANGRAHAPHDGYECPLTGRTFSAGEFLPMSEPEDQLVLRGGGKPRWFPRAVLQSTGEEVEWVGTKAQMLAVREVLVAQTRALEASQSRHLGEVGAKVSLEVEVTYQDCFEGAFGPVHVHVMKTATGDVVVYKGSKLLAGRGKWLRLTAKVKEHGVREGVRQTVVSHPKAEVI